MLLVISACLVNSEPLSKVILLQGKVFSFKIMALLALMAVLVFNLVKQTYPVKRSFRVLIACLWL